ncbi:MAG: hypothetical protein LAQ30_06305 [Acidobacteriia bacterium]|nr:hypothetical protein [Terriglobia bacterium]
MRRYMMLAAICTVFVLLFATPAYTQNVPTQCGSLALTPGQAFGTGPLSALTGVWSFKLAGFASTPSFIYETSVWGVAGVFTVSTGASRSPGPSIVGNVTAKETVSVDNSVVGINMIVSGTYQIDTDCTGGSITLGNGMQAGAGGVSSSSYNTGFSEFRFYFAGANRDKIYLVTADSPGTVMTGEATKVSPIP